LLRCLVVSGEPIGERVAWRGPIVMNNEEELEEAYRQLDLGDFDFESE
jgi:redox-sensitive bicupin YhaK (pirin superfamily)